MRCKCGAFITDVGDVRCQDCCKKLIDEAMVQLATEDELVQRFIEIDIQHRALQKEVEAIYMGRVKRALMMPDSSAEERVELALTRARECPDSLTRAFAADMIRQFKIENGETGA